MDRTKVKRYVMLTRGRSIISKVSENDTRSAPFMQKQIWQLPIGYQTCKQQLIDMGHILESEFNLYKKKPKVDNVKKPVELFANKVKNFKEKVEYV